VQTVIENADLVCVVCSAAQTEKFLRVAADLSKGCPSLKYIIQMEPFTAEEAERWRKVAPHITVKSLQEVERYGAENPVETVLTQPEDIFCIEVALFPLSLSISSFSFSFSVSFSFYFRFLFPISLFYLYLSLTRLNELFSIQVEAQVPQR